ncbi:MAG: hypothetical protein CMD30_00325 [Flavobacteriales bacterium]|nr:hypothetical protein [Flavobacteriales bacterium]|tara:strand:+ start:3785 stop:4396 length:612 start_codon:yes stop_codon:yes gene_type:complete
MKKLFLILGIVSLPSFAAVSANVSFTSDYIWRGMTQSDAPAIQGGFDFAADNGFYAGLWGSNVNFNNGAGSELDYYFGYATEVGSIGVDVGYISYEYIDSTPDATFDETYLGLSYGDFGVSFAFGDYDYTEVSYALGDVSFSYGDYDGYGSNFLISYGFSCGSYDCALAYSDFSNDGSYGESDAGLLDGADEDSLVFSVSASL